MANSENKPKPKPQPNRVRNDSLMIRCRPAWRGFIGELAKRDGAESAGELIERAVAEYAVRRAFPGPIPPR